MSGCLSVRLCILKPPSFFSLQNLSLILQPSTLIIHFSTFKLFTLFLLHHSDLNFVYWDTVSYELFVYWATVSYELWETKTEPELNQNSYNSHPYSPSAASPKDLANRIQTPRDRWDGTERTALVCQVALLQRAPFNCQRRNKSCLMVRKFTVDQISSKLFKSK